ncbi:hypothetical protein J1614_008754 [Plenodomus biglobosus]|nr:hypothetical protein J1614_008754 [Plenodomus biglobosus]
MAHIHSWLRLSCCTAGGGGTLVGVEGGWLQRVGLAGWLGTRGVQGAINNWATLESSRALGFADCTTGQSSLLGFNSRELGDETFTLLLHVLMASVHLKAAWRWCFASVAKARKALSECCTRRPARDGQASISTAAIACEVN